MYFGAPPDLSSKAGHDSAGVTAPSTRWFLAEGATGPFFETFILLANPNPTPADGRRCASCPRPARRSTARCTMPAQRTADDQHRGAGPGRAGAGERRGRDPSSPPSLPIVAERAQVLAGRPGGLVRGAQQLRRDGAADALGPGRRTRGEPAGLPPAGYQTYVLLANPGTTTASVTITFLRETGAPVVRSFSVAGRVA